MTIRQTPNTEYAKEIRQKLKENNGYCPCRINKTPDTKCMCKEFKEQIEKGISGECHCGLYIAKEDV